MHNRILAALLMTIAVSVPLAFAKPLPPKKIPILGYLDFAKRPSDEVANYCQPFLDYWSNKTGVNQDNQQVIATCFFFFTVFVQTLCFQTGHGTDAPTIPFMQAWVRIVRDPQFAASGKSIRDTLIAAMMGSGICLIKPKLEKKPGVVASS